MNETHAKATDAVLDCYESRNKTRIHQLYKKVHCPYYLMERMKSRGYNMDQAVDVFRTIEVVRMHNGA